jgi:hypothetical protein
MLSAFFHGCIKKGGGQAGLSGKNGNHLPQHLVTMEGLCIDIDRSCLLYSSVTHQPRMLI